VEDGDERRDALGEERVDLESVEAPSQPELTKFE
jgi:hypothetical protein